MDNAYNQCKVCGMHITHITIAVCDNLIDEGKTTSSTAAKLCSSGLHIGFNNQSLDN